MTEDVFDHRFTDVGELQDVRGRLVAEAIDGRLGACSITWHGRQVTALGAVQESGGIAPLAILLPPDQWAKAQLETSGPVKQWPPEGDPDAH